MNVIDVGCSVCGRTPLRCRGYCNRHYLRWRRHGNPLGGGADRDDNPASLDGLWANSAPTPGPLDTLCRIWQKSIDAAGYGRVGLEGKVLYVHRRMYELVNGPVPDGLYVCHRCDVRACCAQDHLFVGTPLDNNHDAISKGRATKSAHLTEFEVQKIRALHAGGVSAKELAERFERKLSTIYSITSRKTWSQV